MSSVATISGTVSDKIHMMSSKGKMANVVEDEDGQIEYCCVSCPVRTTDKEKLELHLVMHNKEYRFLCGICGTGLKRKEHLDRHTLGHQEVRPHICPECGKGFKRKEHLNIHMSIHSGDKSQVCPLCNRSFYRKDHLQKHLQTHNKIFLENNLHPISDHELIEIKQEYLHEEEEVLDMPVIDNVESCEVITERDVENSGKERPYECPVCLKTYKRKDHLKLHSITHQARDKVCSECGKAFHRDDQLLRHMNVHLKPSGADHREGITPVRAMFAEHTDIEILPLECDLLVPRVNYKSERIHHDIVVPRADHKAESRPHECPICHRKFKRRQHLKVHANVHLKLQPTIWCSLCNEGFSNNQQFESHHCMAVDPSRDEHSDQYEYGPVEVAPHAHDAKKENDYPPEYLHLIQENDDNLPVLIAEEEQNIPTPLRVYVCKFCSKAFKRKDHYKIHLHIHTGVKSFFCPECGKGFYRKDHLQKHTIIHQKLKPKLKKEIPALVPINTLSKKKVELKPEITITAPSNTKLRVPLQIKVPYQVVMSMDNGEQRAVIIDPQAGRDHEIFS